jgi:carboxyl-terminal processing protease
MRTLAATAIVLAIGIAGFGAPGPEKSSSTSAPPVPAIRTSEAVAYAVLMDDAIRKINLEYIREMSESKLAAVAIQSLFEAAGAPTPSRWRGAASEILQGKDVKNELIQARMAAGNPPALIGDNAIRLSLQAMAKQLDPYCSYVSVDEISRSVSDDRKIGVGVQFEERGDAGPLSVRSAAIGSSAQKERVFPGDQVLFIDGESTIGMSTRQGNKRLNEGPPDSHVDVVVRKLGKQESRPVRLYRKTLHEESLNGVRRSGRDAWDYILDPDQRIAYVRLGAITRPSTFDRETQTGTAGDLQEALLSTRRSGLSGLVLDLRDCPIGLIDQACSIVELFLPGGGTVIAKVRYRDEQNNHDYRGGGGKFVHLPMVVLVGPDTSGAGELIAAALQDHHRAPVVGQRTRGKDTVQPADDSGKVMINDVHGLRLSVGQFHRPSGKNLGRLSDSKPWDEWGVLPDEGFEVRLTSDVRRQIRQWRQVHDLRAPDSREVLPLDDWSNDPVLFTGLKELRRLIRAQSIEDKNAKEKETADGERTG